MEVTNVLVKSNRSFITETDLEDTIQRYMNKLDNPQDLYNTKNMLFYNLLRYIYKCNIQYILPEDNTKHDYELMDKIYFTCFIPICYHFGRIPSVHSFIIHFLNYDITNIYDIRTGLYSGTDAKPNPAAAGYIAKWEAASTSDLLDYVVHSNSIGGMFRLKTKGFSEEQRITVNVSASAPTLDTTQLGALVQSDVLMLPDSE